VSNVVFERDLRSFYDIMDGVSSSITLPMKIVPGYMAALLLFYIIVVLFIRNQVYKFCQMNFTFYVD
jgi:hypothetical protein